MRFFRRKKKALSPDPLPVACPHCGSRETRVTVSGAGEGSHIKAWRGERYVTLRCLSCGRDFYGDEPPDGVDGLHSGEAMIEDEEALREAEEDLKRRTDEQNDRRYMP